MKKPVTHPMAVKESDIQIQILRYLKFRGHFVGRINTGGVYDKGRKQFRFNPWTWNGVPDIILFHAKTGKLYGLEVKRPSGKQSEHQVIFQDLLNASGNTYAVVCSIEDCEELGL